MSRRERDKGARFERQVARLLGAHDCSIERVGSRGKRDSVHADITHEEYYIQCKHYKRIGLYSWWKGHAELASEQGKIPLLVFKQDRDEILVTLRLEDFLRLTDAK